MSNIKKSIYDHRLLLSVHITAFEYHIISFISEKICHCQEDFGFEVFGHFCVADKLIEYCCKIVAETAVKKVTLVLGEKKVKYCETSEFRNECYEYFERYYKFLAKQAPLVLPSKVIPPKVNRIVDTMTRWCQNTAKRDHGKESNP